MKNWRKVEGFEEYMVSSDGTVLSYKGIKPKLLKPQEDSMGYYHYRLYNGDNIKLFKAHRLVCETYLPKKEGHPIINHKNGDKKDNRLENLEWSTHKKNMKHAWDNGLMKTKDGSYLLSEDEVKDIIERYIPYKVTYKMLAEEYGVSITKIRDTIIKHKNKDNE